MGFDLPQAAPAALSAFLASLVECTEALTIILAVGTVRGWRGALAGAALALLALGVLVSVAGPALTHVNLTLIHITLGALTLAFGLRWLRKAVRRAAGTLRLRDENLAYARETERLRAEATAPARWDAEAIRTAFQITLMEGVEVVFIVIAIGAATPGLLRPAEAGAALALAVMVLLGLALHRPIAAIPENTLKFAVAVMLCGFGTFWLGEGLGLAWPGGDASLVGLAGLFLMGALVAMRVVRPRSSLEH
jgi:uncharacterized membrane protein